MSEPMRISAEEARRKVTAGKALLVCAYEDVEKFRKSHLEDAISLQDFKARLPTLSREQEIVFY